MDIYPTDQLSSGPAGSEPAGRHDPLPTSQGPLRVLLVGLETAQTSASGFSADDSLDELALLVDTWGGEVVARLLQTRAKPDPSWFVGKGKLEEVAELTRATSAQAIAVDGELTPVQLRNMDRELGGQGLDLRVIDRTQVILEIFARRASSREGRLEVDLAQAQYALPRLTGKGLVLSRLGGGIGTRGPGETKLEVDRRRLREHITSLKREIEEVGRQREVQARARHKAGTALAAFVGYTNAGKSTLFNALTGAGVLVEDKLFATLDPVVRRLELPGGQKALVSDTVGFIRKLPHHLMAAFRATLEEVRGADVIVHVIDVSDPAWPDLASAAATVLEGIWEEGHRAVPVVYALNKIDRLPGGREEALSDARARELARRGRVAAISAARGAGLEDLKAAIAAELAGRRKVFSLSIPYAKTKLVAGLHEAGRVLSERYTEQGVEVEVELEIAEGARLLAALGEEKETGNDH